jgi:hypothetical protein
LRRDAAAGAKLCAMPYLVIFTFIFMLGLMASCILS